MGGAGLRLGQVATRTSVPDSKTTSSFTQIFSRTVHTARDSITSLQAVFPNWYSGAGDIGPGGASTLRASIEYPLGTTPQRLFFGGATSVSIPDGDNAITDAIAIAIPAGAEFAVKTLLENPLGVIYSATVGSQAVDRQQLGTGALVDNTTTATNPSGLSTSVYSPAALIAQTSAKSVFLAGDSRARGATEDVNARLKGELERSIGNSLAFINASKAGEALANVLGVGGYPKRQALAQYCTHVLCNYGINDIVGNSTAATIIARLTSFSALFGKPFYQVTIAPRTSSTDAWATTVNQAQNTAAQNTQRVALNAAIRTGITGVTGFFEVADVVESARDSGIWQAGYTTDGLHENATGYAAIATAGVIPPAAFT